MGSKVLILYSELAGYTVNCFNQFVIDNENSEIHVIRWSLNMEAPFVFSFEENIIVQDKNEIDISTYIDKITPSVIICSGWFDKEYLAAIKKYKNIPSVLMFDNYWENSLKQKIGKFIIPFKIKPLFDLCWLPGQIQKEYALMLGFKESQIYLGFYATDLTSFNEAFVNNLESKSLNYPKRFLYVGRYLTLKGVEDLWQAFIQFAKKNQEWELHCVGTGELFDSKVEHPKIVHHGFLQPEELPELVKKSGALVMPSHYDHWGMAVQEFAAAGLPLICSDTVGANCAFLQEERNGYIFKAKNVNDLETSMHKIALLSSKKLLKFGKFSNSLSGLYDIHTWSNKLGEILEHSKKIKK